MTLSRITFSENQIRFGVSLGIVHVVGALIAHFAVPPAMEARLGLVADPWFRRETGTVNAGFAYGLLRVVQGKRDTTFLRSTAVSGLLMAAVRSAATLRGRRGGALSAAVIGSDLALGIGGLVLANQLDRQAQHPIAVNHNRLPPFAVAGEQGEPNRSRRVRIEDLEQVPRPGAPHKLAHIVFKTPRIARMIDWYTQVLDAVVVFQDKRVAFLTYDHEHHRVALIKVPALLRIPSLVWKVHRKFFGVNHIAFGYNDMRDLVATYRRLAEAGIEPVWCINHGPTTSMYYEDPDGNRLELQVDNFTTKHDLLDWLASGEFDKNPIGVEFDPEVLERLLAAGTPRQALIKRGSAPPDGRPARSGMRTLRWKTL